MSMDVLWYQHASELTRNLVASIMLIWLNALRKGAPMIAQEKENASLMVLVSAAWATLDTIVLKTSFLSLSAFPSKAGMLAWNWNSTIAPSMLI